MNAPTPGAPDAAKPTLGTLCARLLLRLRLALLHANPLTLAAAILLLVVVAGLAWTSHAVGELQAARAARTAREAQQAAMAARAGAARVAAVLPASVSAPAPDPEPDNLARFYGALGERRDVEQQVKTLFALAAGNGLSLAQGEYRSGYDRNARVHTYQVNLPVKGSYAAIWEFALGSLRAIPFAALDDIGFRRDDIKDTQVEARLRLTLYLSDRRADDGPARRADGLAGGAP